MRAGTIPGITLRVLWQAVRVPMLMMLVILEPVVSFVLGSAALLGLLMTFFWKWVVAPPSFPFWTMLTLSLGFGFALLLYEALIVALSD